MSYQFLVTPKPDAYVNEWVALEWVGPESFAGVKRLIAKSPWVVQLYLDDPKGPSAILTQVHPSGVETWRLGEGDFLVKSPHGKFWIMGDEELQSQFDVGYAVQ
jgi:hypothetical protein